ncbi:MAG TPA: family 10 glycosylhydrolase [Gemmatimonadaceae bacterium]|nr:family 10 glycosylhydrolase [Gemmatimonadaceae bacterium]
MTGPPAPTDTAAPPLAREMRGVWIATVANIDWPSRNSLSADQQRAELTDLFDRASVAGLNAVILQVRPAADALYASAIEPWGAMLTGHQGTDPGYDPLAFAVTEAHARGLQIHAWINPFRAGNTADSLALAPSHVFHTHRELVRVYGSQLWLDPGEPAAQDYVIGVISDIVRRYDVDALHADDYFYPYPEKDSAGRALDFPDSGSYARSGSALERADWRRDNVDRFVERLNREVHQLKPTIAVGISPFGIWRPGNPSGVVGLDAYASLYADSRKWLQQGWLDYIAPQLYWSIGAPQQSFPVLLDWWIAQNGMGRHVWPGLAAYRVGDGTSSAYTASEIPDEIRAVRSRTAGTGELLYNASATLKRSNGAVAASLAPLYASRALVPAYSWLDTSAPGAPTLTVSGRTVQLTPAATGDVRWWAVRVLAGGTWTTRILFGDQRSLTLDANPQRVIVNAVDQAGNASPDVSWRAP